MLGEVVLDHNARSKEVDEHSKLLFMRYFH